METPAEACLRLAGALEDLVTQEAACLQARDFTAILAIQKRAQPLVNHLATHGPAVADEKLKARISAILARRSEFQIKLAGEIEEKRQQIATLEASQRRAAQVAPVYGRPKSEPRRRLSVSG